MADTDVTAPLEALVQMAAMSAARAATERSLEPELGGGFSVAAEGVAAGNEAGRLVGLASHTFTALMLAAMDVRYAGGSGDWLTYEVNAASVSAADLGALIAYDLLDVVRTGGVTIQIPTTWLQLGKAITIKDSASGASAETPILITTEGAEKISNNDSVNIIHAGGAITIAPNAAKSMWKVISPPAAT